MTTDIRLTDAEKRHILFALKINKMHYGPKDQFDKRDLRIVNKLLK